MPKSKENKPKKNDTESDGPESDPFVLFRNYSKQCESVGIEANETIKKVLCQNENPNSICQLLIFPQDNSTALSAAGCRALVSAILGECNDCDAGKYTAFKEIRICNSNIGDEGAIALSRLLSKCDGIDQKCLYLELPDNFIGTRGALALGRSLCCGVSILPYSPHHSFDHP